MVKVFEKYPKAMTSYRLIIFLGLLVGFTACDQLFPGPSENTSFGSAVSRGVLNNADIYEASGLAVSRHQPNFIWTHNDSGDPNRIFLLDATNAQWKATVTVENATNLDWEDMAAAVRDGVPTLYVGDTGDNLNQYSTHAIYRFPEPNPATLSGNVSVSNVERITYRYPDGQWDAEALMVDPQTLDIYIISKVSSGTHLYRLPYPQSTTEVITAETVASLSQSTITAADISPDGQEILMKDYLTVYYWKRNAGESIAQTMQRSARVMPYFPEPQGEAIAFATDRSGYYTLSEDRNNIRAHLYFYPRK
ncbi:PE-PGRS family protein [Siphonobacter curvatus]|uniref:PE-PGRS family protein n=2 Tax=Siphonobacter curvatus TaxID=2094562 RepID=A0A2S7IIU6_9BACT|nr:PE-PGRS family protein [Siphonobacter curvatus]